MSSTDGAAEGGVGGRGGRGGSALTRPASGGEGRVAIGPLVITVRSDSPTATEIGVGDDSLTVMIFEQLLQRILRILPRTLSSAMEYLVEQRSQTNFMPGVGLVAPRRALV